MCTVCISLVFPNHLTTYLKEGILIIDPRLFTWRFMFLKAGLSLKKKSVPLRILSLNILESHTEKKPSFVLNVVTSLKTMSRIISKR